ncbi:hypothetical protein KKD70_02355 [Patescibacteria group bacterium]|nr:hypothetical protein [Patescibacteria group bacterium]
MNIIYLDLETTDLDETARIVQLAYKNTETGQVVNEFFKPPVTISFGAMATHHITEGMVAGKPAFDGSPQKEALINILQSSILVAHNAPYDIGVLKTEGVQTPKYIDTLQVARHLIESDNYQLQYLRYSLALNVEGAAHDALGDIQVLEKLFEKLINIVIEKFAFTSMDQAIEKLLELTEAPVLVKTFKFGKYQGKSISEVVVFDKNYVDWLYKKKLENPTPQDENILYTLKHYLGN